MAGQDAALAAALGAIADASEGQVALRIVSTSELGGELGIKLRSPNPVYDFRISPRQNGPFRSIAYTLIVDGSKRVATRAEALAAAIAAGEERFFELNPFLLVFDYNANRFMAIAAATLFSAFERAASTRAIRTSSTAAFSLTPSFENRSISMYATVTGESVWYSTIEPTSLNLSSLITGLERIRTETLSIRPAFPKIIAAINSRLEAVASGAISPAAISAQQQSGAVAIIPAHEIEPESEEIDVRVPARIWRMILTAILSSPSVLLVGPPGTGKTALLRKAIRELSVWPLFTAVNGPPLWATPDESWTARELVGGETIVEGEIEFRAGWVLRAISEKRWLVLDEANRADMDRIFGGLLTWLSGGLVSLGVESAKSNSRTIELGWKLGVSMVRDNRASPEWKPGLPDSIQYLAGEEWRLLGTYNALDAQRVFRFGAALGRRFVRVPIPAVEPELFAEALNEQAANLPEAIREGIRKLYEAHYSSEATRLGPALFFAICRYVRASITAFQNSPIFEEEQKADKLNAPVIVGEEGAYSESVKPVGTGEAEGPKPTVAGDAGQTLAEAYLVHVGTWLAHLESRDFQQLEKRIVDSSSISQSDWSWLSKMISALA